MAKKRVPSNAKAKDFAEGIGNDLREDIEGQLSVFINSVARDLASKEVSPVLTGFFASSWQVSKTSMPQSNQVKINPWLGNRDYIAPRFKVPTKYKFNQPIYIGNRAEYTGSALDTTITYSVKTEGSYNVAAGKQIEVTTTYSDIKVPIEFIKSEQDEGRELREAKLYVTPDLIGDHQPTFRDEVTLSYAGSTHVAQILEIDTKRGGQVYLFTLLVRF